MDTRCIFPQHTAQIPSVIIQAVTWLACKKTSLFIISTSKQKGFSHRNFLLHFLTKARPYGWCNQWYQVGAAHMLLCYYELGPHRESTKGNCCLGHWLLGVKRSPGQEYCSPHSMACTEIQTRHGPSPWPWPDQLHLCHPRVTLIKKPHRPTPEERCPLLSPSPEGSGRRWFCRHAGTRDDLAGDLLSHLPQSST